MSATITRLTISIQREQIDGDSISISIDTARQLHEELGKIFGHHPQPYTGIRSADTKLVQVHTPIKPQ